MGREEEIAYAREHGIPVKGGTEAPPYSIDDNLWGRSSEGGAIEDLDAAAARRRLPARHAARGGARRAAAGADRVRVRPAGLDRRRAARAGPAARARRRRSAPRHGVGIVDHIEDRIVGLKVRDLYEVPAAAIVLAAHQELEKLVSTIHQNNFKHALDRHWAYLCYAGLWHEPLREDLDAYMDSANRYVTGEVTMKLYKGSATPVARSSPYALYDRSLAGVRRVRRRVLPGGEPRLHRALLAAEPDGA